MKRGVALVLALVLAACTVDVTPKSVLFEDAKHPPLDIGALQAAAPRHVEAVELRHGDGVVTRGIHMSAPEARAVIVYLPGNRMRLAEYGPKLLPRFAMLPADLYWLDYRGLGASGGTPGVAALAGDSADLLVLAARSGKPVVVHGLSMGSLLAGWLADDPRVAALVLEGAIPTIAMVADATTPGEVRQLVKITVDSELSAFDNLAVVRGFTRPLLVLVGSKDDETPPGLSRKIYDAAVSPKKQLVIAPGASHTGAMTTEAALAAYRMLLAGLP